ncbi:3-keto-disaccharide hydrolase [Tundrisphaera lichenicola]|uniref:3-keto-disaccharide hydrolase n=1 Tax=Tundrisphaera lichenicola TaxID=2029860 RepID=UPI003EC04541
METPIDHVIRLNSSSAPGVTMMKNFVSFALTIVLFAPSDDPETISIVRGSDPTQFELVGLGPDSISIRDGIVRLTGKPLGYFATKQPYRNFILSFEWRYERPEAKGADAGFRGNSGLLIHVRKPHKVWPDCTQVQLAQVDAGALFGMGDSRFVGVVAPEAQSRAILPVGQWNRVEVTAKSGSISCILNGIEVSRGLESRPEAGAIGWQSEGEPVQFRKIQLQPIP